MFVLLHHTSDGVKRHLGHRLVVGVVVASVVVSDVTSVVKSQMRQILSDKQNK